MNTILEISSKNSKSGRRKIEMVLHKIHTQVQETNRNGIHWTEEHTLKNIESVKGIPICAEFVDDEKEVPLGHGYTATEKIDGVNTPLFENSVVVGVIDHGEIRDVVVNGETIRGLVGIGYLYEQRFPRFVKWVKEHVSLSKVDTSIEIVGTCEHGDKIVYEGKCSDNFRVPSIYNYSGVAILSVLPADEDAVVLECAAANQKKKEENLMDEKVLKELIVSTICETNGKKDELNSKIEELNATICKKEAVIAKKEEKIVELNATVEQLQKALDALNKEQEAYRAERNALEKELGELKSKAKIGELTTAIADFSDEEKKVAESDINSFKENPLKGNVELIVSKIYAGIGQASKKAAKEARTAEQNAAMESKNLDIFSEVNASVENEEDINIF